MRLVLDGNLIDEHNQLVAELGDLIDKHGPDAPAAEEAAGRVVAHEQLVEDATVEFVFQAMGRGPWRKLHADHPPTEEQAAQGAGFDTDVFPFVAMAACLVSPKLTREQLEDLNDRVLDEVLFARLWGACLDVNVGEVVNRPGSAAARSVLRSVRLRSEQPSDSESVEAG